MTSPLPPKRRDTRRLEDLIRQDRQNLRQLGVGFVGGRFPPARPLNPSAKAGDLEDDEAAPEIGFFNTDRKTATGPGTVTMTLTHTPIDGSLHVRWNGLDQPPTEWTLAGNVLTIPDPSSLVRAGDVFTTAYAYEIEEEVDGTPGYVELALSYGPLVYLRQTDAAGSLLLADASGNGHTANANGGGLGAAGLVPSLLPDTSSDYSTATGGSSVGYGTWLNVPTIALKTWVNLDTASTYQNIIDRDNLVYGRVFQFRVNPSGRLEFIFWTTTGGPYTVTGGTALLTGHTYLIGASFNGSVAKVYVNDAVDGTLTQAGTLASGSNDLTFGNGHSGAGGTAVGQMDGRLQESAMYTSLTDANYAALYAAGMAA